MSDPMRDLGALLDLLKAKGVASFTGPLGAERVCVTFGSLEPSAPADDVKPPLIEEERCKCGCPLYQHTNDGCGNGCDAEKCGATP